MLGIKAGDDGEMIGKSERRIAWEHALRRPNSLLAKCKQVGRGVAVGVVPAEPVKRNQHHVMLRLRSRGVGPVVDVDERKSRILPRKDSRLLCGQAKS